MTNKKKIRVRKLAKKTGKSYAGAVNLLNKNKINANIIAARTQLDKYTFMTKFVCKDRNDAYKHAEEYMKNHSHTSKEPEIQNDLGSFMGGFVVWDLDKTDNVVASDEAYLFEYPIFGQKKIEATTTDDKVLFLNTLQKDNSMIWIFGNQVLVEEDDKVTVIKLEINSLKNLISTVNNGIYGKAHIYSQYHALSKEADSRYKKFLIDSGLQKDFRNQGLVPDNIFNPEQMAWEAFSDKVKSIITESKTNEHLKLRDALDILATHKDTLEKIAAKGIEGYQKEKEMVEDIEGALMDTQIKKRTQQYQPPKLDKDKLSTTNIKDIINLAKTIPKEQVNLYRVDFNLQSAINGPKSLTNNSICYILSHKLKKEASKLEWNPKFPKPPIYFSKDIPDGTIVYVAEEYFTREEFGCIDNETLTQCLSIVRFKTDTIKETLEYKMPKIDGVESLKVKLKLKHDNILAGSFSSDVACELLPVNGEILVEVSGDLKINVEYEVYAGSFEEELDKKRRNVEAAVHTLRDSIQDYIQNNEPSADGGVNFRETNGFNPSDELYTTNQVDGSAGSHYFYGVDMSKSENRRKMREMQAIHNKEKVLAPILPRKHSFFPPALTAEEERARKEFLDKFPNTNDNEIIKQYLLSEFSKRYESEQAVKYTQEQHDKLNDLFK